jgi:hypothetical protein
MRSLVMVGEMKYSLIRIPNHINKPHKSLNIEEAEEYYFWFNSIRKERLTYLLSKVLETSDLEYSRSRMDVFQYFFSKNIYTKDRDEVEVNSIIESLPPWMNSDSLNIHVEFIEPTISICLDLAIWLGQLLIDEIPGCHWAFEKDKKFAHYGRPVIMKLHHKGIVDPIVSMGVLMEQIYKNEAKDNRISELYVVWKNGLLGKKTDFLSMIMKGKKIEYEEPGEGG